MPSLLIITAVTNCRDKNIFFPLTLCCRSAKFAASREVCFCTEFGKQYRDTHGLKKMKLSTRVTTRPHCPGKEGKQLETAPSCASTTPAPRREAVAAEETSFPCPPVHEEGQHEERKEAGVFRGRARGNPDFLSGNSFSAWAVSCRVGTSLCKGLTTPPVSM